MFLEKGKVFRKEGEKRRKKIGNRADAEGQQKIFTFSMTIASFICREGQS